MSDVQTEQKTPEWKKKALKLAGLGYSVGDLTMAGAAHLRGEKDVFNGALIWLAGGVAAARYGNPNPDKQLELFSRKLEAHLRAQGVEIPDDVRKQNELLKKPGVVAQVEDFLYQHPSEVLNAAYAIGSGLLLHKGFKEIAAKEKKLLPSFAEGFNTKGILRAVEGMSKNLWMGALVGGGAVSGLLIKEDPNAREKAAHGNIFQKIGAYFKEKPLRLTGSLYGANNIFTVLKAVEDKHLHSGKVGFAGLKPHYLSGVTAGMYILSNVLLSTVSRDQEAKKLAPEQVGRLEEAAATMIAAQTPERQKLLLAEVADYMAHQKNITLSAAEIEAQLAAKIAVYMPRKDDERNHSFVAKETARREATPLTALRV